ncbi:efflux RND transporter periplasmic adaptor subunit [Nocardioides sp. NPDC057772]|uniref:efflux RND transporter periplasmic adaptor subunit n=1 Tax=Nocardioides sp. NPDC057772 TaxID=3346245 RepID=UPI003670862B
MSKTAVRRVLFKSFWAVIGLVIAVSLFKLAFTGSTQDADGAPLTPTGEIPPEEVVAEKGTISNSLTIDGTIVIDKPVSATSSVSGVLAHRFAETGAKVRKGDKLFQVRVEEEPAEEEPVEEEPVEQPGNVDDATGDGDRDDAPVEPAAPKPVYHWYTVVAPATGIVGNYAVDMMADVAEDGVVVSIRPTTFHAVGAISPLDRYRLAGNPDKVTVTIEGGPKPFTCTDLRVGDAATETIESDRPEGEMMEGGSVGEGESGAGARISCLVPQKVTVFDGLTMTMTIDAGTSDGDVVTIPVTAVTGLVREGTVWVVGEDGTPTEQPVKLGLTDGKLVEVTSGLKAGDSVLRYVPGSKESGGGRGDEMAEEMPMGEM